jgi:transcriptional regulator with XRE-family HTH domain
MLIGQRLRQLREGRNLSQADVEKRTGLLRAYVSRVEKGHTVPSLDTLERWADALEVPLYQLFYEGGVPPGPPSGKTHGRPSKKTRKIEMSDDARLVFGTLAKAYSKL